MNWADWTIVGILSVSCLISIKRGFVKEALSLAVWIAAFVIALIFGDRLATLMTGLIDTPSLRAIAAFAILFAATLVVGAMVNYLIGELVRMTGLSGTDRLFGMVFGLVRGAILVMALVILMPSVIPVDNDVWWRESALIPRFLVFEHWARETSAEVSAWVMSLFAEHS
ncbi:CvpA family protein [Gilvimarinus algae]|uniref:CvpA family protein n=1 Tax=Gilvimarinus algae TaxID=3058037 RepID=A0ABT8TJ90_9GAMM|nr:CvpA family protein [Gilvimarinus sp. SDUM040014]MDO3384157.1 CvpA family protein [Gilvimarinus sp. SDUM040014]